MKKMEEPKVKVVKMEAMDVIATSGPQNAAVGATIMTVDGNDNSNKMGY